jgi:hypothetical protein
MLQGRRMLPTIPPSDLGRTLAIGEFLGSYER